MKFEGKLDLMKGKMWIFKHILDNKIDKKIRKHQPAKSDFSAWLRRYLPEDIMFQAGLSIRGQKGSTLNEVEKQILYQ